jgi:hypothetical protein
VESRTPAPCHRRARAKVTDQLHRCLHAAATEPPPGRAAADRHASFRQRRQRVRLLHSTAERQHQFADAVAARVRLEPGKAGEDA